MRAQPSVLTGNFLILLSRNFPHLQLLCPVHEQLRDADTPRFIPDSFLYLFQFSFYGNSPPILHLSPIKFSYSRFPRQIGKFVRFVRSRVSVAKILLSSLNPPFYPLRTNLSVNVTYISFTIPSSVISYYRILPFSTVIVKAKSKDTLNVSFVAVSFSIYVFYDLTRNVKKELSHLYVLFINLENHSCVSDSRNVFQ